jgi:hypothetical protein
VRSWIAWTDLVIADLRRIDEVGHAEFSCHLGLGWIEIDANDLVGADHAGTLDDVKTDTAEAEYDERPGLKS